MRVFYNFNLEPEAYRCAQFLDEKGELNSCDTDSLISPRYQKQGISQGICFANTRYTVPLKYMFTYVAIPDALVDGLGGGLGSLPGPVEK